MTHDELLLKVNELDYVLGTEPSGDKAVFALRAVVELHKPATYLDYLVCDHCCSEIWPCPTIQDIQKELK